MYSIKTNDLEKQMVNIFGEDASLVITKARLGKKGYLTRIESYGLPFRIEAREKTSELSEDLAIKEFEKHTKKALAEKILPTQPDESYETIVLTSDDLNRLYKHMNTFTPELLDGIKKDTVAKISHLDDFKYECVIDCPYMNIHARGEGANKKLAVASAIWAAYDILNPYSIRVGDWWIGSEELETE